jgi:hypothetical protein
MKQVVIQVLSIPYIVLFVFVFVSGATYPNNPETDPPSQWASMSNVFTRHCSPFGVSMFAQGWPRDKFVHACNILAQMLDNDQDGCADDIDVVKNIRKQQAGMILCKSESSANFCFNNIASTFNSQGVFADETKLSCSGSSETSNCRDAAIEEILHLVSNFGLAVTYPAAFSDCNENFNKVQSSMQKYMDVARGGKFSSVPNNYPSSAIYHYDDKTCDYGCMGTEYFYWALTSLLHGQDKQATQNMIEWEASTRSQLRTKDNNMYKLLTSNNPSKMRLLSLQGVLPGSGGNGATATYKPSKQKCSGGCGLDGVGCGTQGSSQNADLRCTWSGGNPPTPPSPTPPSPTPPSPTPPTSGCSNNSSFSVLVNGVVRKCGWFSKNSFTRCKKKGALRNCPVSCKVCTKHGEQVCEGRSLNKAACLDVGCCQWDTNKCWSRVGQQQCFKNKKGNIFEG